MSTKERSTWRSPALGEHRTLQLPGGRVGVHETGSGAPIVFVHGLLVNANLWRKVVERLAPDFRCISLDLPLGSHLEPAGPDADLSPPGLAALVTQSLEALELEDATLVGNDTGGALCQIAVTTEPGRIGRLVLTSCDYADNFPPAFFRPLKLVARIPGATQMLLASLRPRMARRMPTAYGWLTKRPIDRDAEDSYLYPSMVNRGVRHDLRRVLPQIHPRYTREAAAGLAAFDRPALIAWAKEDKFFPTEHAEELARTLPQARLEWIEDTYTFSPEDQPERLAELVADFAREPAKTEAAT